MKKFCLIIALFVMFSAGSCDSELKFNNPNDRNSDAYQSGGDADADIQDPGDTGDTATDTGDTLTDTGDTATDTGDTTGDGCATEKQGQSCTTDDECGNCMICLRGGICAKGCVNDADCTMQPGLYCNKKLARCLNIYASNKACSETNCPTGCCYAEKGLSGLKCAREASPAKCGLCNQGAVWSPEDSQCYSAVCSTTTDNCPSFNKDSVNPPADCYKCRPGELICQTTTAKSGCSASGYIINTAQCIPSGQRCEEGITECCSGMPCISGYCY